MDSIINPYLLFVGLAVAGVGVAMAVPRKRVNPQVIGAVIAGVGLGVVLLGLALANLDAIPNLHFYVFGLIALGASLRVVTHPRPVYAALYFILSVLASCGLYVVLSAEFMAFALVIIYAGAILITYLFVIMLATQSPSEERVEVLAEYDVEGRRPVLATIASFVLLAGVTSLMFKGTAGLEPAGGDDRAAEVLVDAAREPTNTESIGVDLLLGRPGTIEIAGVILLMAMLGATVLARRQVDLEDEAKHRAAEQLAARGGLVREEVQA